MDADLAARYPEVAQFTDLMLLELAANARKGDQAGWRGATPDALLNDITWHWAKLAMAWREWKVQGPSAHTAQELREYAADVANMSMMFIDNLGLLEERDA